jgi:hypothetical protein
MPAPPAVIVAQRAWICDVELIRCWSSDVLGQQGTRLTVDF